MQKTINKIAYLDGIRGIAAFVVVIHHFLLSFYISYYTFDEGASHMQNWDVKFGRSIYSVVANGNFCVCIFFVLSGFVLSRKYFQTQSVEVLVSGAQRRFLRLYIPVAATIILAFIMMQAHLFYNHPVSVISRSEWWFGTQWDIHKPWLQLFQCIVYKTMFIGDGTFVTSMWTIAIEFYGSLFVFAFLALTHDTRNRITMIGLSILYCYYTSNAYLSAFVLGIALNYFEINIQAMNKFLLTILPVVLLALGLLLGSFPSNDNIMHTFYARTPDFIMFYFTSIWFHIVGAFFVVLSFVLSPRLQHFISLRLFRFLGYISFALYLLHPIVIGSVTSYFFLVFHNRLGYNHTVLYLFFFTIAVSIVLSWLLTKYIDSTGIKYAKYVYERYVKK